MSNGIFAYGSAGAGKTFSLVGKSDDAQRGIVPRVIEALFAAKVGSSSRARTIEPALTTMAPSVS